MGVGGAGGRVGGWEGGGVGGWGGGRVGGWEGGGVGGWGGGRGSSAKCGRPFLSLGPLIFKFNFLKSTCNMKHVNTEKRRMK